MCLYNYDNYEYEALFFLIGLMAGDCHNPASKAQNMQRIIVLKTEQLP